MLFENRSNCIRFSPSKSQIIHSLRSTHIALDGSLSHTDFVLTVAVQYHTKQLWCQTTRQRRNRHKRQTHIIAISSHNYCVQCYLPFHRIIVALHRQKPAHCSQVRFIICRSHSCVIAWLNMTLRAEPYVTCILPRLFRMEQAMHGCSMHTSKQIYHRYKSMLLASTQRDFSVNICPHKRAQQWRHVTLALNHRNDHMYKYNFKAWILLHRHSEYS